MKTETSHSHGRISEIFPSQPTEFTHKNFAYKFEVKDGDLICRCTFPANENKANQPMLFVTQGLESMQPEEAVNSCNFEIFRKKCASILLIQLKDAIERNVIFTARAFPKDNSYNPFEALKAPKTAR